MLILQKLLLFLFPIPVPEVIEHHKENYEAEVAAELMAEAAAYQRPPVVRQPSSRSSSSSEWSSGSDDDSYSDGEGEGDDGISSLFSEDLVEGGDTGETATSTMLPIDFDIEMDVECMDDIYDSTDSESSISPQYVTVMITFQCHFNEYYNRCRYK